MSSTVTVSKAFRGQLQNLMATLRATEPHYIKCIKPNNVKAPGGFRCADSEGKLWSRRGDIINSCWFLLGLLYR